MLASCSVGQGQGDLRGDVTAEGCALPDPPYDLRPSFFTGEVTGDQLNIRVQRGSDLEGHSDGLILQVLDINDVRQDRIGLPVRFRDDPANPVQAVFYLNETCPTGFPDEFRTRPYAYLAVDGTITFEAIYAPGRDPGSTLIQAQLDEVRFEDRSEPTARNAILSGYFSFFYQRGSPAQRFP